MTEKRAKPPVTAGTIVPGERQELVDGGRDWLAEAGESLDHALLAAQTLIAGVAKGDSVKLPAKENSGRADREYTYTSCEDMLTACRLVLHEAGLLLTRDRYVIPDAAATPLRVPWVDDKGIVQEDVVVVVESHFRLLHLATEEVREYSGVWPVIPSRGQPWDKALGGALSSHWTYFLRDLLLVPRPDGNEMDKRDAVETRKTSGRRWPAADPAPVETQEAKEARWHAEVAEQKRLENLAAQQEERRLEALRARAAAILDELNDYAGGDVQRYLEKGAAMKPVEIQGILEESKVVHRELSAAIRQRVKELEMARNGAADPQGPTYTPAGPEVGAGAAGDEELPDNVRDELADMDNGLGRHLEPQAAADGGTQEDLEL